MELVASGLIPCDCCSQKGWILLWHLRTSFCFPAWRAAWKAQTWWQSKNVWQRFCDRFLQRLLLTVSRSFMNVTKSVLWRITIILKASKVNLFVSSVFFVFWYHSPNFLVTPLMLFAFGGDACACVRVWFKMLPRGLAIQNYKNWWCSEYLRFWCR